ncbi:MAG: hypothetical protein WAK60_05855 [Sedimentisphaerales bacterium]
MLTKKNLVSLAILLIAGTALLGTVCFAAEQAPKAVKVVQGFVGVNKDANDVITKVTLTTKDKVVYDVVLNAKGMELGKKMASKEVEVEGTISKEAGQETITVMTFKAVEKAPAPPPAPAPKPAAPEAK